LTATVAADMTAEVVDNTIISRILSNGDTSAFVPSTDGLQLIRDKLTDIETDTNELQTDNIPGTLTTIEGKVDTIDGIVDNILIDTGTTLQAELDGIQADTEDIQTQIGTAGAGLTDLGGMSSGMKTEITQQTGYKLGAVWFDTGGAAGAVSFVNGIITNPCSSSTNTHTLLTNLNLKVVRVVNASNYVVEATYNGFSFIGEKWTLSPSGQQMINCYFEGATITSGTFHSNSTGCHFLGCVLDTVTLPAGNTATSQTTMRDCGLAGTITVNAAGQYTLDQCYSAGAAGVVTIIDFGAAMGATTIRVASWNGNLQVNNMKAGDVLVLDGNGLLTIDSTCTAGTAYIRGNIELTNNGSGQTITDTARFSEDQNITNVTGTVAGLGAQAKLDVNLEADTALSDINLDHLCKTATVGADMTEELADNTILSRVLANGDTSVFVPSTDGLQPIRDHIGDGTNLTEAGGTGDQLSAIPWNAGWDAEVQSECTDALNAYDPPTNTEMLAAHTTTDALITTVDTVADGIQTDLSNATDGLGALKALIDTVDGVVDAILADTGTDGVVVAAASKTGYALSAAGIDAIWDDTGAGLSLSYETLMERIYMLLAHKMNVTDADGSAAIRNAGDSSDVATGSITDNATTTVRAIWSWV
jgi:hypothetical protein